MALCPTIKVCCVFSSRVLLSSYSGQPRATAAAFVILGVSVVPGPVTSREVILAIFSIPPPLNFSVCVSGPA